MISFKWPKDSPPAPPKDPFRFGWRYVPRTLPDGKTEFEQVPLTPADVLHPQEDDFIVQNDIHAQICRYFHNVLKWRMQNVPGAVVLFDHRVDWQVEGVSPHGPDFAVMLHAAGPWRTLRGTYYVRDHGAEVAFVIEVTSPTTRDNDLDVKVMDYARAGIPLYLIVDVRGEVDEVEIVLIAYRATPDGPRRVALDKQNRIWLPDADLWVQSHGDSISCLLPNGTPVGDYSDRVHDAEAAQQRADAEQVRADAEQVRAETEKRRADAEKHRADAEQQQTQREKLRAEDALKRIAELEVELRRRGDA